jgi:adenylate kinase
VKSFVESGHLVPDEVMGELIAQRLARPDARGGFVLDGFPRTMDQVGILDSVLARLGVVLDRVFLFTAPEAEIVRRLAGRRTCPRCGAVFHVDSRPPRSAGVCDACGSALVQRADDAEDVIRERLRVYAEQTMPVTQAYARRSLIQEVDGAGDPEAVFARLQAGLAEA